MLYRKTGAPRARAEPTLDLEMMERVMEMELGMTSEPDLAMFGEASASNDAGDDDDPIVDAFAGSLNQECAGSRRLLNQQRAGAALDAYASPSPEEPDSHRSGEAGFDHAAYDRRREALERDFEPKGPFEIEIVARIVLLHLEIERVIEYRQILIGGGNLLPEDKRLASICRNEAHLTRMASKWLQELRNLRRDRANAEKIAARSAMKTVAENAKKRSSKRAADERFEIELEISQIATIAAEASGGSNDHTVAEIGESIFVPAETAATAETSDEEMIPNGSSSVESSALDSIAKVVIENPMDSSEMQDVVSQGVESADSRVNIIAAAETPDAGDVCESVIETVLKRGERARDGKIATSRRVSKSNRRARRRELERAKKFYPAVPLDKWYSTPEFIRSGEAPIWPGKPGTISVAERADALGVAIW